jgi:hypothetical protein
MVRKKEQKKTRMRPILNMNRAKEALFQNTYCTALFYRGFVPLLRTLPYGEHQV